MEASWLQVLSARAGEEMNEQRVEMLVARPDPLHPRQPTCHRSIVEGVEVKGLRQKRAGACGGRVTGC